MKNLIKFVLVSSLLASVFGCSAKSSEKAADEARGDAANARDAADTNARTVAADAHLKDAEARVAEANARAEAPNGDAYVNTTTTPAARAAIKERLTIPSGTVVTVLLIDALGTDTNSTGDRFLVSLAAPVVVDGNTLLAKGTKVRGRVIGVEDSGRVKGVARIRLALTDIMQGNRTIAITTDTFSATAESSTKRDPAIVAGGAGVGAISGGGAGTGVVLATKGKEIHYAPETRLSFRLASPVRM
jgi:hypothetical protein